MSSPMNAPTVDPLVDELFRTVLTPPRGYSYHPPDGQLLFPVYGRDQWRLLLRKGKTFPDPEATVELTPVFLEGDFIRKLTKALNATQRELNAAVSDEIPEPVKHARVS